MSDQKNGTTMSQEPARDIKKVAWRLILAFQCCENFEREQAYDFLYCILPFLKRKYKDRSEELKERLTANNNFFNCNPVFTGPVLGMTCAMEENEVDEETIQSVKVGLMGPLAGIGDTLVYTLYMSVLFAFGAALATSGSIAGPIMVIPLVLIPLFLARYYGTIYTFKKGMEAMDQIMTIMDSITSVASKFGCVMAGAMAVLLVSASTPLTMQLGKGTIKIQDRLDSILPGLIPLLVVGICYLLLKKAKLKPVYVLWILLVVGMLASVVGVL